MIGRGINIFGVVILMPVMNNLRVVVKSPYFRGDGPNGK